MSNNIKKYLLFMFGNWTKVEKNSDIFNNIKDLMESIVLHDEFSFITGDHVMIMCIKSKMSFEEIDDMLKEFLTPYISTFFLMPKPRKLAYRLDGILEQHLFGKDGKTKPLHNIDPALAEKISKQLRMIVESKVNKLIEVTNPQESKILRPFTLDCLLDKIIDEGMSSLTIEEKEFLNKFNK